jgi:hypothetical protein
MQPQLLAILCLTRYEDWTFSETEVRLGAHNELCQALGSDHAPDDTTLYRFLRRLDEAVLERILSAVVQRRVPLRLVRADAEFDRERNHQHIRQTLQAHSVIPAKRGGATWQLRAVRAQMRHDFPADLYRRRALIERLISAIKRKLSACAPGRSLATQCLQALLLGIAYNRYRL